MFVTSLPLLLLRSTQSQVNKSFSRLRSSMNHHHHHTRNNNPIIIVGSANVDFNTYIPGTFPNDGETILGSEFKTSLGGKGANQAVAAARLIGCGGSSSSSTTIASPKNMVNLICKVGNDIYGKQLVESLEDAGIGYNSNDIVTTTATTASKSKSSSHHTGIASITVNAKGENTIVVVPGSNHDLTAADVHTQLEEILKGQRNSGVVVDNNNKCRNGIVMTQLEIKQDVALEAMKTGRMLGALTILNPAPAPSPEAESALDANFFQYVDIIIPNEIELRTLTASSNVKSNEEMAKELLVKGIQKAVIVTLGEKGAMIVEKVSSSSSSDGGGGTAGGTGEFKVSNVKVPPVEPIVELQSNNNNQPPVAQQVVVDTVGAGDCFCGSLAVYLSSGLDIIEAAQKACGVSGISVRKRGAQSSYPHSHELPKRLRIDYSSTLDSAAPLPNTPTPTALTFVTGNKKKLEEVQQILGKDNDQDDQDLPYIITNRKLDLPELQGDPNEIAIEKCKLAAKEIQGMNHLLLFVVDDIVTIIVIVIVTVVVVVIIIIDMNNNVLVHFTVIVVVVVVMSLAMIVMMLYRMMIK